MNTLYDLDEDHSKSPTYDDLDSIREQMPHLLDHDSRDPICSPLHNFYDAIGA